MTYIQIYTFIYRVYPIDTRVNFSWTDNVICKIQNTCLIFYNLVSNVIASLKKNAVNLGVGTSTF